MDAMNGIVGAYISRLRKHVRTIIIYSAAYGGGIIALLVLTAVFYPELYTPLTRQALKILAERILGVHGDALAVVAAAVYSPFLAALIAAFVASGAISSLFMEDRSEGVFEVLLSAPISMRRVLTALLVYTLLASLFVEAIVMAVVSGISLFPLYLLGYLSSLGYYYIKLSILLVPSLTLPAALISLLLTVVIPSLGKVKTGLLPGHTILNSIPILIALIPFLIMNINPQIDPGELALYTAVSSVIATFVLLLLLPRIVKEEIFLR